jgi:hypothetical protein
MGPVRPRGRAPAAFAIWVLAAAGCNKIDVGALSFHCAADGDCAPGYVCDPMTQLCSPPGALRDGGPTFPDAEAWPDAAPARDAEPAPDAEAWPDATPIPDAGCDLVPDCVPPPPRPAICWSTPTPIPSLLADRTPRGLVPIVEGGQLWAYFTTSTFTPNGNGDLIARLPMLGPTTLDQTRAQLADPQQIDLATAVACFINGPVVAARGLEMFYSTCWPDGVWTDYRLRHAVRTSTTEAWSAAADAALDLGLGQTSIEQLALLGDGRTLVLQTELDNIKVIRYARRTSTSPTSRFELIGSVVSLPPMGALGLSCDRWHVLYADFDNHDHAVKIAAVTKLYPLEFGPPAIVPNTDTRDYFTITEADDCNTLYVGTYHYGWMVATRVSCP